MPVNARIVGVGSYLPEQRLKNADLERMVDTSDEWIVTRTGIRERRLAAPDQATSHLGAIAARRALETSELEVEDIELLIVATSTPDMFFPSSACLIQDAIGLSCPAYDLNAACTGFIYALQSAVTAIESGRYQRVLVVGADTMTRHIDFTDRGTCVLFGDGAGAVVLEASDEPGVLGITLGSDGSGWEMLMVPAGGSAAPATVERIAEHQHQVKMSGNEVFKFAVRVIPRATKQALEASGLGLSDLDWLIPHQANQRIITAAAERLGMPEDRVFSHVAITGNTSAASIPLALDDLYTSGRLVPGDTLALVGFGAGLTWGAAVLRWSLARPDEED